MFYRSFSEGRTHRLRRARALIALAGGAFVIGAIIGAAHRPSAGQALAGRFVAAWAQGNYAGMYSDIDATSRARISPGEFAGTYENAMRTATATRVRVAGAPHDLPGGLVAVPVRVNTRLFGTLRLSFVLPIAGDGAGARIRWSRSLAFPGLRAGELLARQTTLPRRATLLARDGSVLAESPEVNAAEAQSAGTARTSPLGEVASAVLGTVGPVPADRRVALEAEGIEAGASVGLTGLERALDSSLRGTPGGELLARATRHGASARVLASASPRPAPSVHTTVSPRVQRAAVTALGSQLGGVVAMEPSTGRILAVAGIGMDGLQPPGSTFKMVTVTGVLQAGIAGPSTTFPYGTFATLDGVKLNNANGEECGGSLELAFAVSCNSVFAPLGVKLGAARLVATAERFGFNHQPDIPGAGESTLPPPSGIKGELDVGSTAIGQGQVLASALEMATIAATIADAGRRPAPTLALGAPPAPGVAATSPRVARTVRHLMIGVVRSGTGTAAAIPGVTVAGKTGTAELSTRCQGAASQTSQGASEAGEAGAGGCTAASEAANTDAWFAAFAPALHPRIAVGVLLVKDGAGGATAAPVAREVLEAGLRAGR
jgi:cell division protein FtsI/penicillin-binding protein 2